MTTNTVQVADYCEVTVRRPNGLVETVRMDKFRGLNEKQFALVKEANRKAGRGEVLSYKNYIKPASYTMTAADHATDSTARIERAMRCGE